jgi:hypothetical protein
MKKALALLVVAIFTISISCSQSSDVNDKADKKAPFIKFEFLEYDYGNISQGDDGTCQFVFKNTGKDPLVLSNVRPSCGCTVPKWSKEPIKGGDESSIEVKYNTSRAGSFSKSITVYSNATNSPVVLKIKGNVVAKSPVMEEETKEEEEEL